MKKFILILPFLLSIINFYAQDTQTNPLAPISKPPISVAEENFRKQKLSSIDSDTIKKENRITADTTFELSQNVKDYQYEQKHPNPLSSSEDKKLKFNDFNKPTPVEAESTKVSYWFLGLIGLLFLIFIVYYILKK